MFLTSLSKKIIIYKCEVTKSWSSIINCFSSIGICININSMPICIFNKQNSFPRRFQVSQDLHNCIHMLLSRITHKLTNNTHSICKIRSYVSKGHQPPYESLYHPLSIGIWFASIHNFKPSSSSMSTSWHLMYVFFRMEKFFLWSQNFDLKKIFQVI